MKTIHFAAKMLEIEAHTAMARAFALIDDEKNCIEHLKAIRDVSRDVCEQVLNPAETSLFLAR